MNFYLLTMGTAERLFWANDDTYAIRLARRWRRVFWRAFVERCACEGLGKRSMAYAINTDTRNTLRVYRLPINDIGVVACEPYTLIAEEA